MENIQALMQSAVAKQSAGDTNGAIELYRRILALKPQSVEALCNLGGAMHATGAVAAAIDCYRKALAIAPGAPQIHYNMAGAHLALGQIDAAFEHMARALELRPDYPEALYGLGMLNLQTGRHDKALSIFRRLSTLAPGNADVLGNTGLCLKQLGDFRGALDCFRRALQANPGHIQSLANLAVELLARGDAGESARLTERALSIKPGDPKLLFNLGIANKQDKNFTEAIRAFRNLLAVEPDATYAKLELAHTLQSVCDWRDETCSIQAAAALIRDMLDTDREGEIDVFNALSLPLDSATLLRVARRKGEEVSQRAARFRRMPDRSDYTGSPRLRVAYLSPDYRNHPAIQLMGGLFNAHDRNRLEVYAYSIGPDDGSEYRHRTEQEAEHFVDLYFDTMEKCIERIRSDRIHILVDLAGYTTSARAEIVAARVAPVQVNWLGFAGTLGTACYDYLITDEIITPPGDQPYFTEKFAYLPHCYQINDDREQAASEIPERAACGLPESAFVFCCFNNNYKVDAKIFDTWMAILRQVPDSVLWLLKGSDLQMRNLRAEAHRRGVEPMRLVFAQPMDKAGHLARHTHADLFLDTLYYNAHTTGSDALRQGVPMITCPGERFASRVGASLLHAVGLDELVTADLEEYRDKAVRLATEPAVMEALRRQLRANLSCTSLLDNPGFARSLERLYELMWARFERGEPAAPIEPDRHRQARYEFEPANLLD